MTDQQLMESLGVAVFALRRRDPAWCRDMGEQLLDDHELRRLLEQCEDALKHFVDANLVR